jgi:predicted RNA-binding protein with PUA-like domain
MKQYWLMKTEADCYSIDDLQRDTVTPWEGVRNFQARNHMMHMKVGDVVFFYHSNGTKEHPTGIYGLGKVSALAHPDATQFIKEGEYFDPRATEDDPVWFCVDVSFVKKSKIPVTLAEMKIDPKLTGILAVQKGSRLSVQPVSETHAQYLLELCG